MASELLWQGPAGISAAGQALNFAGFPQFLEHAADRIDADSGARPLEVAQGEWAGRPLDGVLELLFLVVGRHECLAVARPPGHSLFAN